MPPLHRRNLLEDVVGVDWAEWGGVGVGWRKGRILRTEMRHKHITRTDRPSDRLAWRQRVRITITVYWHGP